MDRGNTMMDDSNLHELNDDDIENKEGKPKVTYICGGNTY